jgi:hypothetical protein
MPAWLFTDWKRGNTSNLSLRRIGDDELPGLAAQSGPGICGCDAIKLAAPRSFAASDKTLMGEMPFGQKQLVMARMFTSRQPVRTWQLYKFVSDQLLIFFGNANGRPRLPKLYAITLNHKHVPREPVTVKRVQFITSLRSSLFRRAALIADPHHLLCR